MSDNVSNSEDRPFLPRWARYLIIPGFFGPLIVLPFIFVVQLAHDETRCPYVHAETRRLSDQVSVREDRRNCLWDVEDRRFSVVRSDGEHAIGNRRFRAKDFARDSYEWEASLSDNDEVHLQVRNLGHADAVFREGTTEERAKDRAAAQGHEARTR